MDAPEPPPPPSLPSRNRRGSNGATALALFGLLICGFLLLGLVVLVMPAALGFVIVIVGFTLPLALHYVIWGWWLSKMRDDALERERDSNNPRDDRTG